MSLRDRATLRGGIAEGQLLAREGRYAELAKHLARRNRATRVTASSLLRHAESIIGPLQPTNFHEPVHKISHHSGPCEFL